MTKQELEAQIIAKSGAIQKTIINETTGNVKWYQAIVLEVINDEANLVSIRYYVENEGLKSEVAYFMTGFKNKFDTPVVKTVEALETERFEKEVKERVFQLKVEKEAQKAITL